MEAYFITLRNFRQTNQFEFAALSFHVDTEIDNSGDIDSISFHHVAFHFGDKVVIGRDGYHVRR